MSSRSIIVALLTALLASEGLAQETPRIIVVDNDGPPDAIAAHRVFRTELGLALERYVLERAATSSADALVYARELIDSRPAAAVVLTKYEAHAIVVTVVIVDNGRTLSRIAYDERSEDAPARLALAVRELLGTAHAWEQASRASHAAAAIEDAPAPPPPLEPPPTSAIFVDVGTERAASATAHTDNVRSVALGVQWSALSHVELRGLVEGGHARRRDEGIDVTRTRVGARLDVGYRLGDGVLRFVPMGSGRLGWQRSHVSPDVNAPANYHAALAQLAAAPELRVRPPGRFELTLRPEIAWNITTLRVERVSTGGPVADDPDVVWSLHGGCAIFF